MRKPGYVIISSVLVLAAVSSILLFSLYDNQNSVAASIIAQANFQKLKIGATECGEYFAFSLQDDLSYSGNEIVTVGNDVECELGNVLDLGTEQKQIIITTRYSGHEYYQEIETNQVYPTVEFNYWRRLNEIP